MPAAVIYAVHGFLGRAADWDQIKAQLPNCKVIAEDLFSREPVIGPDEFRKISAKKIFLGYSFGGRAGLLLLKNNPELFDHFVFLSTNPGISRKDEAARAKRLAADIIWAEKISEDNWTAFLREWNEQSVFSGSSSEPLREIKNYDLQKLKDALLNRSLGRQDDYSELIRRYRNKITWAVGTRDTKYCSLAEELKNKRILSGYEKICSGHRIWLDQPDQVVELIKKIIL